MYQGTQAAKTDTHRWQERFARKFEPKPQYLIPLLQYVQSEEGYLPKEAMQAVADFLRVPESKVFGVASFYAQFHFEPRGRNTITVCRGTACHVRGSGPLLRDLERHLGVAPGGTTEDMAFTLETVACYGSCALAPVVVVNEVVHRQQTSLGLRHLVDSMRNGAPVPKKAAPKKAAPTKAVPKKTASKKTAPKKTAPKKAAPKKAAPTKAVPKKTASKKTAPKKTAPKKAAPKKAAPRKAAPKKATSAARAKR